MTPEYIIMTSHYEEADKIAKVLELEISQWKWIRDNFKDPLVYRLLELV